MDFKKCMSTRLRGNLKKVVLKLSEKTNSFEMPSNPTKARSKDFAHEWKTELKNILNKYIELPEEDNYTLEEISIIRERTYKI